MLQTDKLLSKLEAAYRPPKITSAAKLQLPGEGIAAVRSLDQALASPARWALTGESSGLRYAVMADMSVFKVYVTDCQPLLRYENERFYNVLAQQTEDSFPFFDTQTERGQIWASPVQCYLELSKLDKREREIAATVREAILKRFK